MPWPPLQPPPLLLGSPPPLPSPKIRTGNHRAPSQLSFGGLFIESRAASGVLRGVRRSGGGLYSGISTFSAPQRGGRRRLPLPGRGAGLTGAVRVGGKGAAASGCSYPSSGIFPEGNRNRVFKQPVPSIVGSIRSLFSVPAALFLDVSLHPAGFAHAVRNPIPGHSTPVRDRASPQNRVGASRIFWDRDLNGRE